MAVVICDDAMDLLAGLIARVEPRRAALPFVAGLLHGVERKNC